MFLATYLVQGAYASDDFNVFEEKHGCKDDDTNNKTSNLIEGRSSYNFSSAGQQYVTMTKIGEKGSSVIVVSMPGLLLGPLDIGGMSSPSKLQVSTDGGKTFQEPLGPDKNKFFCRKDNGLQPSPVDKNRVAIVGHHSSKDTHKSTLWTSLNGGKNWAHQDLAFRIDGALFFHPANKDRIIAYSNVDFSIWLTTDFGGNWKKLNDSIRTVHWGYKEGVIFALHDKNVGFYGRQPKGDLLKSNNLGESWILVKTGVHSFGNEGKFIYASVTDGNDESKRLLLVSKDSGETWNRVQLPDITPDRFYSVLDMAGDRIFMHVADPLNNNYGTLYTSDSRGIVFSESLHHNLFTRDLLTDFYRVNGMDGVYLTAKVNNDDSLTTMITYDSGAFWQPIKVPEEMRAQCKSKEPCSLQLHISYSVKEFGAAPQGPFSVTNASGLIISHGTVGDALNTKNIAVYISSDGGVEWRHTGLNGLFFYSVLDFGGLIVAIKIPTKDDTDASKTIYYSTDVGHCWRKRMFTNEDIDVKGLYTDPKGHSLIVNIWAMNKKTKEWTVISIDFEEIITRKCKESDYEDWTPLARNDGKTNDGCRLGIKSTFKRLKPSSFCYNDEALLKQTKTKTCPCDRTDYECNFGYEPKTSRDSTCIRSSHIQNFANDIRVCIEGKVNRVHKDGYLKIPGDKCDTSIPLWQPPSHELEPTDLSCDEMDKTGLLVMAETSVRPKTPAQKVTLAAIVLVSIALFALIAVFFGRKFISLGQENGGYKYSRVRANDDGEFDALLPNEATSITNTAVFTGAEALDDYLDEELERGLADIRAPSDDALLGGTGLAPTTKSPPKSSGPPELAVSKSDSPAKATSNNRPNVSSYLSDDDDLIA